MALGTPERVEQTPPSEPPQKNVLLGLLVYFNPKYHYSRFKEDLASFRVAMANRRRILDPDCDIPLNEIFRGKMFGAFFLSGPANLLGISLGYGLQRAADNQWVGLFGTILLCFLFTGIWFQLVWAMDNRRMYAKAYPNFFKRFVAFEGDLLPIHRRTLGLVLTFGVITVPINSLIVGIITVANERLAKVFPTPIIIMVVEAIVASGPIVRLLGDFFDQYSYDLATRYALACNRAVVTKV